MTDAERITLGRVGGPYGIKGWVKLISYTDPLENILEFNHWQVKTAQGWIELEMDQGKKHGKGLIAHFVGHDDPEAARLLNEMELTVPADVLPELAVGDYYWHQLIGLQVLTLSGQVLGRVSKMLETGANDVLVVEATPTSVDQRERLLPWLPDQVVKEVDLQAQRLIVDWEADYLA